MKGSKQEDGQFHRGGNSAAKAKKYKRILEKRLRRQPID